MNVRGKPISLVIGLTSLLSLVPVQAQRVNENCQDVNSAALCTNVNNRIVEIPTGKIDNQNGVFELSALPISNADVHMTIDGSEISQGPQLSVNGQTLTLYPPAIPKPGNLLRVSYQTQFTPHDGPKSNLAALIAPLATQALLRIALAEDVSAKQSNRAQSGNSYQEAIPSSRGRRVGALSMLADRLEESNFVRNSFDSRSTTPNLLRSLAGFEGTGDSPSGSPYEVLFRTTDSLATYPGTRDASKQFRSLVMLGQTLDSLHQHRAFK